MLYKSSTQLAFLSVLLLVLGFYVVFSGEHEYAELQVRNNEPHRWWGCGDGTIRVRIETDQRLMHNGKTYEFSELVQHLIYDFHRHPFGVLNIEAEENVKHNTLVRFSDAVKQRLPDTEFTWESYSELARR